MTLANCGHTYCSLCINSHLQAKNSHMKSNCPSCRKVRRAAPALLCTTAVITATPPRPHHHHHHATATITPRPPRSPPSPLPSPPLQTASTNDIKPESKKFRTTIELWKKARPKLLALVQQAAEGDAGAGGKSGKKRRRASGGAAESSDDSEEEEYSEDAGEEEDSDIEVVEDPNAPPVQLVRMVKPLYNQLKDKQLRDHLDKVGLPYNKKEDSKDVMMRRHQAFVALYNNNVDGGRKPPPNREISKQVMSAERARQRSEAKARNFTKQQGLEKVKESQKPTKKVTPKSRGPRRGPRRTHPASPLSDRMAVVDRAPTPRRSNTDANAHTLCTLCADERAVRAADPGSQAEEGGRCQGEAGRRGGGSSGGEWEREREREGAGRGLGRRRGRQRWRQ